MNDTPRTDAAQYSSSLIDLCRELERELHDSNEALAACRSEAGGQINALERELAIRPPIPSLRDCFALHALTGMLACPCNDGGTINDPREWMLDQFAEAAYAQADAMVKARGEQP